MALIMARSTQQRRDQQTAAIAALQEGFRPGKTEIGLSGSNSSRRPGLCIRNHPQVRRLGHQADVRLQDTFLEAFFPSNWSPVPHAITLAGGEHQITCANRVF